MPSLIEIVNPNPRRLAVWRGDSLTFLLDTGEGIKIHPSPDLRLSYEGRNNARVVLIEHRDDGVPGDEWVQEIGPKPAAPSFDQRIAAVGH